MPVLLSLLMVGCVIPPSLSVDNQDAGTNSPPAILVARNETMDLAEPGPVSVKRAPNAGMLQLELLDTDLTDTLHVRIFVDYTISMPTNFRSACVAAPTGTAKRTTSCDLQAVCIDEAEHQMQIVVFDREPLLVGTPTFKAMPEGGLSTGQSFRLLCEAS